MTSTLNSRERLLAACRRQQIDAPPAWVMRQAGRYLPEYRAVRAGHDFLGMVRKSDIAAEVTLQPIRRFDMDAAVIFSDILVPPAAMGLDVTFHEGAGPELTPHVRTANDVERLVDFDPWVATRFLADAIGIVRKEVADRKAIIGFCGAPWTTASYVIEGGSSRNFDHTKRMLYEEPALFARLCTRLVDNLIPYLAMQIEAGADVVQVFDSWGGAVSAETYREHLLPHVRRLVAGAATHGAPVILYVNGAAQLLEVMADSGADVLGLDWRVTPSDAIARVGGRCALQGNMDPCVLFASPAAVTRETNRTLDAFAAQKGYVFNLGSGILPQAPVASMEALFAAVRAREDAMSAPLQVPRELLQKYATSAPRYTSYPTAVDWSKDFDPTRYPALLAQAAQSKEPISVYVHLPFCAERCLFCGCNVIISRSTTRADTYIAALEREFAFVASSGIGARRVRQYHWGGGTPTQLSLAQMDRVQAAFRRVFTLDADAEIAVEVDPRVTTREQVAWLAASGFNRVSLGVQDFEPAVQEAVKRVQSEEETRAVIDAARADGIRSVNIDLIYGLPEQTIESFAHTVERVIAIRPERIALFHYAHVPWLKKHQRAIETDRAPSSGDKLAIFIRAVEQFQAAGYVYIGLDHFALPNDELAQALHERKLQRNFMGYTTRRGGDMVSLGVSAIGDVAGAFVQNSPVEADYLKLIAERGYATQRGHELSREDALRRDVIIGLMCNGVLSKREIEARHAIVFDREFATELAALKPLADDGLVRLEPDAIRLTELGQVFMRNAALPFDRYFAERSARGGDSGKTFSKTL